MSRSVKNIIDIQSSSIVRRGSIGHFLVPKTLTFKMRLGAQPFSWKWVLFESEWKMISISKVEHLPPFWNRGRGELGNGLFISNLRGHPTGYPSSKYSSEQYQFKHWSKRTSGIASTHAHNHITPVVAVMDACRGRTALRFPTNSSHLYTVELALKEVLCSRLGSKGPVWERRALSLQRSDGFAMRMSCYVYFSA